MALPLLAGVFALYAASSATSKIIPCSTGMPEADTDIPLFLDSEVAIHHLMELPMFNLRGGSSAHDLAAGSGAAQAPSHEIPLARVREKDDAGGGTPGVFNLYIFALSWKAEWCYHQTYPGCKSPRAYWEENLTIHGLWPDYGDGTYPTKCTREAYDHNRVVNAVGLDNLENCWPNVQVSEDAGEKYDSFWQHEWEKHGTCTGLSQEEYFMTGVRLMQLYKTPSALAGNVGGHTTRTTLEDAYGGPDMAVLDCRGGVYLNQVYLCLEVDPITGLPSSQVACTDAIVAHDDTCGCDEIEIASFDDSTL